MWVSASQSRLAGSITLSVAALRRGLATILERFWVRLKLCHRGQRLSVSGLLIRNIVESSTQRIGSACCVSTIPSMAVADCFHRKRNSGPPLFGGRRVLWYERRSQG